MTTQIPKSQIWPEYELAVAEFAEAMRNWRAHMARVKQDEENGVQGLDKHIPYPRPIAPELVDRAVDEDGKPDYEIVDDGPTAEQLLAHKKALLLALLHEAERDAQEKIVPQAKRRLFMLREAAIRNADVELAFELKKKKKGRLAKVWDAALGREVDAVSIDAADIREQRPPKDTEHLDAQDERRKRFNELALQAAEAAAEIDDLTADNVDSWKLPDFQV